MSINLLILFNDLVIKTYIIMLDSSSRIKVLVT